MGSFECSCSVGYRGDGYNCSGIHLHKFCEDIMHHIFHTDIDECTETDDLCAANGTCTNTDGSYYCTCDTGFIGNGTSCGEHFHNEEVLSV